MILLKNVSLNNQITDILIEKNIIKKIGFNIQVVSDETLDCSGKAILPSFCNTHTHASMMFLRGVGEDKNLFDWLNQEIFPREARLLKEHYYPLSRYAILEMIKTGTTCFTDMYFEIPQTIKAVDEMGLRAILPYPGMDFFDDKKTNAIIQQATEFLKEPAPNDRIQKALYCHSVYISSEKLIKAFRDLAKQHNAYLQMHVSETQKEVDDCIQKYGCRPVELLYKWGVVGPKVLFAHSVHFNEYEMQLIKETGTTVAHCPTSNFKLVSGQMDFQKYLDYGINITLGTDGVSSNNSLSMISEMKIAALSAKNKAVSVLAGRVNDIWKVATQNGFEAFGINAGIIEEGKLADFILVDLDNQFLLPNNNLISNMIYAADSSCITDVFCDGKAVMRNRIIPHEKEIIADFKKFCKEFNG